MCTLIQYFDISGLDQSYRTFYDECQAVGFLLPQSWGAEPESSCSTIETADIDRLIRYFDDENGKALLDVRPQTQNICYSLAYEALYLDLIFVQAMGFGNASFTMWSRETY